MNSYQRRLAHQFRAVRARQEQKDREDAILRARELDMARGPRPA